jgi:hypothetical protein
MNGRFILFQKDGKYILDWIYVSNYKIKWRALLNALMHV